MSKYYFSEVNISPINNSQDCATKLVKKNSLDTKPLAGGIFTLKSEFVFPFTVSKVGLLKLLEDLKLLKAS
jgi:hypothetical protein